MHCTIPFDTSTVVRACLFYPLFCAFGSKCVAAAWSGLPASGPRPAACCIVGFHAAKPCDVRSRRSSSENSSIYSLDVSWPEPSGRMGSRKNSTSTCSLACFFSTGWLSRAPRCCGGLATTASSHKPFRWAPISGQITVPLGSATPSGACIPQALAQNTRMVPARPPSAPCHEPRP